MDSLSDKLKMLGVRLGTREIKPVNPRTTYPIEDVIPGQFISTSEGSVYLVENNYHPQYLHGITNLELNNPLNVVAEWAGHPEISESKVEAIAFLDTETSGLAGGTGTFAFMVGVGLFTDDGFKVRQFFMSDPLEEPALLLAIEEHLAQCNILVTYNGKSFDIPLLNTRYILQGWRSPLISMLQIDLLHLARKLWRYRLPSRSLGDIESQILKVLRTEEEVPGWMIPQMYFDYLRSQDARPLRRVFYHNEMDVISMAALLNHTARLIEFLYEEHNVDLIDRYSIARLYEDIGYTDVAINIYQKCLQGDLPEDIHLDALQRLSFIFKRLDDYVLAIDLWEKAARKEQIYAFIELAKYYEHTLRDFSQALYWTESAMKIIKSNDYPSYQRRIWQYELEHRYERLSNKLGLD